ncbi:MAG: glucokinase [Betaproteobacteria bacterium]|nr:glucokinase [Betaproteobacteria bacterium]
MLIAGDIGGTKTLLALYTAERGPRRPVAQAEFPSARYERLEDVVSEFIGQTKARPAAACFDVAGPVIGGRARLTNLPWIIEEQALRSRLGLRSATLVNDLQATAYAAPRLLPDELRAIQAGEPDSTGALAVIAPGTGLGEAFLVRCGAEYHACASEGGHADFAPGNDLEAELLGYLRRREPHVSVERVCSGSGLPSIYDFLRDTGRAQDPAPLAARIAAAQDRTPLIVEAALGDPLANALSAQTVRIFVSILGAEAGNLALKVLATGGVYLGGGVPPRIVPRLEDGDFVRAFIAKGRFEALMRAIPVHVIMTQAALLGAAMLGLRRLQGS